MIRDAEELARRSRQGVLQAQQNASAVAAGLGLLLALTVLGALALTIRSVAHPLERLRRGAELVGSGKLDFRMNMKTVDEVGDLARAFDAMTERLRATTVSRDELVSVNSALHDEMEVRHGAELKVQAQLGRLSLLHQMTRSIGERQDLRSILQVLVRSLEDQLPVDFACVFLLQEGVLEASCVGLGNAALPGDAALKEGAQLAIDNNGLSRCVKGQLVYEPDISGNEYPFPHRLARGGLCSLVLAPLQAESVVFGVLAVARTVPNAFSSGECEFLRQLSEHAALAARQAQLYGALQQAYHTLHATQQSVTREERLRALGQMASGIAHDINNAISPVALYTETLLETETGLSASGRNHLQVIARAIDDVAATVARMRELYRRREPQMELASVSLNVLAQQVADLTRARWSDMPQQRGVVISMKLELAPGLPAVMGSEPEIREALTNLVFKCRRCHARRRCADPAYPQHRRTCHRRRGGQRRRHGRIDAPPLSRSFLHHQGRARQRPGTGHRQLDGGAPQRRGAGGVDDRAGHHGVAGLPAAAGASCHAAAGSAGHCGGGGRTDAPAGDRRRPGGAGFHDHHPAARWPYGGGGQWRRRRHRRVPLFDGIEPAVRRGVQRTWACRTSTAARWPAASRSCRRTRR